MKFVLSLEDGNKLAAYLGKRPYEEVFELINILTKSIVKEEKTENESDSI